MPRQGMSSTAPDTGLVPFGTQQDGQPLPVHSQHLSAPPGITVTVTRLCTTNMTTVTTPHFISRRSQDHFHVLEGGVPWGLHVKMNVRPILAV